MSCLITKGYLMLLQGAELEYRVQTMVDKTSICPNYSEILSLFATMGFRKSTIYFDFLMVCDVLCFCQFYPSIWQILCHFMTTPDALTDFDIDQALPHFFQFTPKSRRCVKPRHLCAAIELATKYQRLCGFARGRRERSIFVAVVAPMCVFSIVKIKANFRIDISQRLSFNTAPTPTVCILTAAAQPQKNFLLRQREAREMFMLPPRPVPPHAVA